MPNHRSAHWYNGSDRNGYIHRAWMRRGLPNHAFDGRPHIAIANTASDLTPCNAHLNEVAESVKQGVYEAGGIPMNLPVVSLGESNVRPTAMLWRNMAAMAAEEMFRANPIDGLVLLGGCDKTIPALLMAAASVDLPAVVVPGGPMLSGTFRGRGAGLRHRRVEAVGGGPRGDALARGLPALGVLDDPQPRPLQHHGHRVDDGGHGRVAGHHDPRPGRYPGGRQPPAGGGARRRRPGRSRWCARTGAPAACSAGARSCNAIVALAAVGGSTNAVIHLLAIAGRLGIELSLDDFDRIGSVVPLLVDLQPAGRFLMEDFHRAGGVLAALREVSRPPGPRRAHGHGSPAGGVPRRRRDLGPRGHPHAV